VFSARSFRGGLARVEPREAVREPSVRFVPRATPRVRDAFGATRSAYMT
jgi:hypothetical protein